MLRGSTTKREQCHCAGGAGLWKVGGGEAERKSGQDRMTARAESHVEIRG